jgi:murein DD-endopeptidase MepM/ murein hydrolase activator NlpD
VDISSPSGTPVGASNSGRVLLADDLYYAGNTVVIDHGLGVVSFYCHFSKILVTKGDRVEKGTSIGEVGATGRVTGPHLHWSVRIRGSRVDPLSLLSFDPGAEQ